MKNSTEKSIDVSMKRIREKIDKACENGMRYVVIRSTGIDSVDESISEAMAGCGYKVASNGKQIAIEW
jgi:anti-anti-sigma regulatory factor